ncbi:MULTISPECIES: enoyl-CoA hydratase/isomerase family protein [Sphingobium]|uniref:enoyl-CoA hydratase/isomerase family protein n=1 Tax=Sphingobium sp. MI1205 TaxID=407020 RepID=UPI0007706985|nr:enoyl-CoA hydratase-related protein [Sphingobium sp. MI1205]AMK19899.1 crotonase [Sphingobium sp. MI1205]
MIQSAEDESYLVELIDGVLRLSFNRPQFGNAIPKTSVPHLIELFHAAQADASVRCILVRGEGKVFSAGGDIAGFAQSLEQDVETRQADFARRLPLARKLVEAIAAFDGPIVTSVRGAAAGAGLFYPLVADYAIGDESAAFVFAHQRVALSPDGGVTAVLPQVVGTRMARMLLMTAAKVDAEEALRLGILHRIVAADALEDEAMKMARRLARAPQLAIKTAKKLVNDAPQQTLGDILDSETAGIVACVGDPDFAEGVRAFLEKRPTSFPSAQ